jgi:hypothetical protein
MNWIVAFTLLAAALLPMSTAAAEPLTSVHMAGTATGYLGVPCNCAVSINVAVNALGSAESLAGSGVSHASTGITNQFSVAGSTSDGIVLLHGTVTRATGPTVGSPVVIEANVETGEMKFWLGPITGGPFEGDTLEFVGTAKTVVVGE